MAIMDYDTLQTIKKNLPYGAIVRIARMAKVSLPTVRSVFEGKSNNDKVMTAIIKVTELWKEKQDFYMTALNKSANSI
jgi:hypothetical protein